MDAQRKNLNCPKLCSLLAEELGIEPKQFNYRTCALQSETVHSNCHTYVA